MVKFTKEYEKVWIKTPGWQDLRTLVDKCITEVNLGKSDVI
jgi:hypothetical protein